MTDYKKKVGGKVLFAKKENSVLLLEKFLLCCIGLRWATEQEQAKRRFNHEEYLKMCTNKANRTSAVLHLT